MVAARRAVPIRHAHIAQCALHRRRVRIQRIALEHHMLIQMKQPRVFGRLRNSARFHRDFHIRKRHGVIFRNKHGQPVVERELRKIFNRRFFCKNCLHKQNWYRTNGSEQFSHTHSVPPTVCKMNLVQRSTHIFFVQWFFLILRNSIAVFFPLSFWVLDTGIYLL